MEIFLVALEKGGPWAVVVLVFFLLWDKERREEKGIREAIRDQVAALQVVAGLLNDVAQKLDVLTTCLQQHDAREQGDGQQVKMNAKTLDLIHEALTKIEDKIDNMRGRAAGR